MAYSRYGRRRTNRRNYRRTSVMGRRRRMLSRVGRGRYRRRTVRRGREIRLVISAPRGILARPVATGTTMRYRRSRRY